MQPVSAVKPPAFIVTSKTPAEIAVLTLGALLFLALLACLSAGLPILALIVFGLIVNDQQDQQEQIAKKEKEEHEKKERALYLQSLKDDVLAAQVAVAQAHAAVTDTPSWKEAERQALQVEKAHLAAIKVHASDYQTLHPTTFRAADYIASETARAAADRKTSVKMAQAAANEGMRHLQEMQKRELQANEKLKDYNMAANKERM